ncbi:MAG: hypothetical protein K2Q18_03440 [Bdellovibrionales bacterium]|nr:hypothetical protein [Bdellovibrionales bacterium]
MKIICLILSILITETLCANVPQSEIKKETELKINLTESGYKNLRDQFLKDFKGEKIKRQDFYLEIFENGKYLLKRVEPAIKLRLMWDGLDIKWQIQQTQKSWVYSIFSFKETLAESQEISGSHLLNNIEKYHEKLSAGNLEALEQARSIQKTLTEKGLISFAGNLCKECTIDQNYYSSHINEKIRTKIKLRLGDDQFNVQVGETNNQGTLTYELEAEVKKSENLKASADLLKEWLFKRGMTLSDIETKVENDPANATENALKKLIN